VGALSTLAATVIREDPATDLTPITDAAWAYLDIVSTTDAGAIVRWGEDNLWGFPADQVWVDSQFMFGVFLLREHERTGERAVLEQLILQHDLFSDHCRDPNDQLYRHAYDDATGENPAVPIRWTPRQRSPAYWRSVKAAKTITAAPKSITSALRPTAPMAMPSSASRTGSGDNEASTSSGTLTSGSSMR
jgi:hypothetical protein